MQNYETPKIEFNQLTFFESIASNCWGGNNFYFDADNDHNSDWGEGLWLDISKRRTGCKLNTNLKRYIEQKFFRCNKDAFKAWCTSSGINNSQTVSNTGVSQVYFNSGCVNPPRC